MKNRIHSLTGILFLAMLLAAGSSNLPDINPIPNPAGEDPDVVIEMTNQLTYTPDTVTVEKGDVVLWKNSSLLVHSVTADPAEETMEKSVTLPSGAEPFNSGLMDPEETFQTKFMTPGTYNYFCMPHEAAMRGTVIVKE